MIGNLLFGITELECFDEALGSKNPKSARPDDSHFKPENFELDIDFDVSRDLNSIPDGVSSSTDGGKQVQAGITPELDLKLCQQHPLVQPGQPAKY
ncbi:hypothetical protein AVEN_198606-1 [Araneus ventricosus]|uniref:Uncharacterized protein n=2 Tax=Araneus ventricosus TaxID=182803 RepID=A0A4Y2WNC0_ARAVE|nr:hypothetical protein AVEN_198606-1 [Araneus ventricosus]